MCTICFPIAGPIIECTPLEICVVENTGNVTITCTRPLDKDVVSVINIKSQSSAPEEATGNLGSRYNESF